MSDHPRFDLKKGHIYLFADKKEWEVEERRGEDVWFVELGGRGKKKFSDRELARMFHAGQIIKRPSHLGTMTSDQALNCQLMAFDTLAPKYQTRVKRQHAYVSAYLRADQGSKSGESVLSLIKGVARQIADEKPPSHRSVLRWTRRFIEREGDARYLAGRQAFSPERQKRLHPLVIKTMKRVIGRFYLSRRQLSIDVAYGKLEPELERLKRRYPQLADKLVVPSRATFAREIQRVEPYVRILRRKGKQAAYRQIVIKSKGPRATRPLQIVMCDSKVIDMHWIDRWGNPRDRLTLTVLIDVYSRMIIGFYLGTAKPSWVAVSQAIRNAVAPKDYIRELYEEIETEWPCCGTPELIIFDQGTENNNTHAPVVLGTLGIDTYFVPGGWPEHKGIVERFFKTINRLFHNVPSTTRSNPKDLAKADRDKKSAIEEAKASGATLEAIREATTAWILEDYHNSEHTDLQGMSPLQAWQKGVSTCLLRPPPADEQLVVLLGKATEKRLQHYGINLFGLIYRAPELARLRPETGSVKVRVKWDPADISKVWVQDPKTKRYIKAVPDDELYTRHLSEAQHKRVWKETRAFYASTRPSKAQLRATLARIIAKFLRAKPKKDRLLRGPTIDPHREMPWGSRPKAVPADSAAAGEPRELLSESLSVDTGLWDDDILALKLKELQRDASNGAASDDPEGQDENYDPDDDEDEESVEEAAAPAAPHVADPVRSKKAARKSRPDSKLRTKPAEPAPVVKASVTQGEPAQDDDDAKMLKLAAGMQLRSRP